VLERVRSFARNLTGGDDRILVGHLTAQLDAALAGIAVARALAAGERDTAEARTTLGRIESRGDEARRELIVQLSRTLAAPMDREDLFRLSRSIDDVLDNLRDFVREYDLFDAPPGTAFVPVLAAIEDGLKQLQTAVERIVERPAGLTRGALAAKKMGNQVRQEYQAAVAELLRGEEVTMHVLKCRELLRRLDVVGLRIGEAADALADGAMKRSH
jgi:uncharacterized protein